MTKLKLLSILLLIILSGCGQKGPLLVAPETDTSEETEANP